MGAFDEAIREHLELKRKLGASEEELEQQESEALGRGKPRFPATPAPQEPEATSPADEAAATEPPPEPPISDTPESARAALAEPDEIRVDHAPGHAPEPVADIPDEPEPDEVLPDESLDPASHAEDVLEETPDFLEEAPEQDSLWFEQRAPKDFDFGD